ncbi:hypothetical protein D3C71_777420 [compost metagenome]
MKPLFSLLFVLSFGFKSFGQIYSTNYELKTVIQQRNIYLNGGARASIGGKSRTIIPVKLPEGTKSWYYSFSTSEGVNGTQNLNLLIQLSSMLVDPSSFSRVLLSSIELPKGSSSIDVYTLDQKNADLFVEKVDNNGGSFSYFREGLVTNTRQAVVELSSVRNCYIGLKNPSTWDGVNVTIEVVALVETQVYKDIWSTENKHKLYEACLNSFASKGPEIEQVCDCYRNNILTQYKPSEYYELSIDYRHGVLTNGIKKCSNEDNKSISVVEKDKKIKELFELYEGQSITKDYKSQETTLNQLIELGYKEWSIYNSLGFSQLCLGKYEEARKSLQIGLGKNPTELYLLGNLASYFLLTDDYSEALKILKEHKKEKLSDKRKFKIVFSEDLKEFERLGFKNENFEKIRKELNIR